MFTIKEKSLLNLAKLSRIVPKKYPISAPSEVIESDPFFIISSGRSGTTLLASILDAHTHILMPPEQFVMHKVIAKYKLYNWMPWSDLCNVIVGDFARSRTNVNWQLETAQLLTVLSELAPEKRSLRNIIDTVYRAYGKQYQREFVLWGDKSPKNTLRISEIFKVFPDAKYIALVRDGRDVVSSMLAKQGDLANLEKACDRWLHSLKATQWIAEHARPEQFHLLRYEQLVSKPQKEINRLLGFLGCKPSLIKLDNREYLKSMGSVAQAKHFENLYKPISTSGIGSWKKRLSRSQCNRVEAKLSNALAEWSYE